jgi:ankyrin repeat protein
MSGFEEHPAAYRRQDPPGRRRPESTREALIRSLGPDLTRRVRQFVFAAVVIAWLGALAFFLRGEGPLRRIDGILRGLERRDVLPPPPAEDEVQALSYEQVRERGVEEAFALALEKYPEKLRELLAVEGVDPNLRLPHSVGGGWAHPLELAVRQGTPETFRILLEAGADVNGAGSDGSTALHAAARLGWLETVDELLQRGADVDRLAVSDGERERGETLRAHGHPWEAGPGAAVIERAAEGGHREVVSRLLDAGADPRFALEAAGSTGDVALVDLLLARGADARALTSEGESMLRRAAADGHFAVVRQLLDAGSRPCEMTLREAASNGRDAVLRAFSEAGVRFDGAPGYWGPLYMAAQAGHTSTVALLLELGASADAPEGQDRPIDAARAEGHADVVALLEGR